MIRGDWGHPQRVWGLEATYDAGRMIPIYQAINELPIASIVDVACGVGIIADGLSWVMPHALISQFDIVSYPEWQHLNVKPVVMDISEFVKEDHQVDLVMFLNSYRNWDEEPRKQFDAWVKRNARYFIYSGDGPGQEIGEDVKGHKLKLYEIAPRT